MANTDKPQDDNPIEGCPFGKRECSRAPRGKATQHCVACVESSGVIQKIASAFMTGIAATWIFGAKSEPQPDLSKCVSCNKALSNGGQCPLKDWRQQTECQKR